MSREKLFNMRLNDDEWGRVEKLCAFHGINAASLLRMLLKKEERELDVRHPGWGPNEAQARAARLWAGIEGAALALNDVTVQGELARVRVSRAHYQGRHGIPSVALPQEKVALAALEAALADMRSRTARDRAVRALEQLADAYTLG